MRRMTLVNAALALLLGTAGVGCVVGGPLAAHGTEVETRSLDAGGEFILENVNGHVTVATWSEGRVRIEAEKAASSEARLREVRVEIEGEGSRVAVRTRMPRGGFFGGGAKVDYRITLPTGARVRVSTVNGGVTVDGVTGEIRAATTNGHAEISGAAGPVQASSVNGGIEARYRSLDPDAFNRFSTTNGGITISLPEGVGGHIEARTVNGGVRSDLKMESTEKSGRHRLEGRLGKGRGSLEVSTVNGGIHLRRG